jgi:hypothetical protein
MTTVVSTDLNTAIFDNRQVSIWLQDLNMFL